MMRWMAFDWRSPALLRLRRQHRNRERGRCWCFPKSRSGGAKDSQYRTTECRELSALRETLWTAAAELAKRYGVNPTARALRLDYTGLRKRVENRDRPKPKKAAALPPAQRPSESSATTARDSGHSQMPVKRLRKNQNRRTFLATYAGYRKCFGLACMPACPRMVNRLSRCRIARCRNMPYAGRLRPWSTTYEM